MHLNERDCSLLCLLKIKALHSVLLQQITRILCLDFVVSQDCFVLAPGEFAPGPAGFVQK
jgi:hypothetical protein